MTIHSHITQNEYETLALQFFLKLKLFVQETAAIITQESQDNLFDLFDDGNDDFPVGSGSDIESETEEKYTKSDTTDEDKLEKNVFGSGPIPKQRRGCQTRGDIRGGINVSRERHGTQPPHKMSNLELNHHKMSNKSCSMNC